MIELLLNFQIVPLTAFPCNHIAEKNDKKNMFEDFFNDVKHAGPEDLCPMMKLELREMIINYVHLILGLPTSLP